MSTGFGVALPESWNWCPLKFTTTFLNRGTAPTYVDDGPVRTVSQAVNQLGYLDWGRARFHHHEGDPYILKGHLLPNDILVNSTGTGTLGRVGYFVEGPDALPCVADGHITVVRADEQAADPRYLYYWLSATPFQDYIYSALTVGATNQIELNRERLAGAPVALPPLGEQRHIADFLDAETSKIDLLVETSARQSELLAESLHEAIRVATTTHSGPTLSTGIDWMPYINTAWRLAKVSHVFMTGSGTTPSSEVENYFNGDIPWVNSADLNDRDIRSTIRNVSYEALRDYPALKIHPAGSLIVAMYGQGETKGRVGLLGFDACVNQACCVLTPLDGINAQFASYWFRAHKNGVVALAVGAGQPNLSQELIRQLRIPIPDVQWQDRIVAELQELENSIATRYAYLDSRSRLLTERRQALITAAVTGQIDVTTARRFTPSESVSV